MSRSPHRLATRALALGLSLPAASAAAGPRDTSPTGGAAQLLETIGAIRALRPDRIASHYPVAITATGGGVAAPAEWSMSSKLIDIVSWTSMLTTASLSQPLTDDVAWTCQAPSSE